MKKFIIFIIFFISGNSLFCHAPEGISVSLLPLGYSINISENNEIVNEFKIGLYSFSIENMKNGIGIEYKLPQYYYFLDQHMINFISISPYWNIFSLIPIESYHAPMLGPFISINYLNWYIGNGLKFSNYILNIGIRGTFRLDGFIQMLTIESGYKNANGIGNYYFSIEINILTFFGINELILEKKYNK